MLDKIGFDVGNTRISIWGAIVVIVVVIGVLVAARLGGSIATRIFGKITRLDPAQQLLGEKLVSIAVWVIAFLVGIDILHIDLTALTVFSGAFGLAVGFGLQKTFGNLIAGIILLMDRSIKPGDVIAIANSAGTGQTFGQVKKIGIRAVSITTRDQREYLIPNENLMTSQVENWSYSSRNVRIQVPVGVAYGSDMDLAEKLMLQAAKDSKRILDVPSPTVWMHEYGHSSVNFVIQCWINDPEEGLGNVRSAVLKRLWVLFKENGIELPFPQRDLNFRRNEEFDRLVTAIEGNRDAPDGD
ncbi:mechanosensitive ion channel [Novosphingobium sp. ZN18A2]|uniref:mechanosensitive ion channel family protein n=1 Tax=Novosphingobium sp. ZN18A2 TaxID=3079861 RepID=UPI0030CDAA0E